MSKSLGGAFGGDTSPSLTDETTEQLSTELDASGSSFAIDSVTSLSKSKVANVSTPTESSGSAFTGGSVVTTRKSIGSQTTSTGSSGSSFEQSDGSVTETEVIIGPPGPVGPTGPQGPAGQDGADGADANIDVLNQGTSVASDIATINFVGDNVAVSQDITDPTQVNVLVETLEPQGNKIYIQDEAPDDTGFLWIQTNVNKDGDFSFWFCE